MDKLKFALVGCGRIGTRHAEHIAKVGELVAICDVNEAVVKKYVAEQGVRGYTDVDVMLQTEKMIDVVSVCTPNGLHAEHSIKALKSGCHVLCEKPLAISANDCGRMIQAAESANRRLFVVKQNRYNPPVVAVKNLINEGRLGRIFSMHMSCNWNRNEDYYRDSWKGTLDMDGGTLFTQFSHFIDLVYWFFGDVKDIQVKVGNFAHKGIIEFEDTGVVLLEFYNGMLGSIHYTVNSYNKNMEGSLTIFGENGTVKIGGQYLNELEYQNIKDFEVKNLPAGNKPNDYGKYQGSMSNHGEVYRNLVDVLVHGHSITTSAYEGMKTVEIIERIYRCVR